MKCVCKNQCNITVGILFVFRKKFVTCNSKNWFNTLNGLSSAVIPNASKPEFLSCVANYVEAWSTSSALMLTKQTSHALMITLRATSYLLKDLLNEDHSYILTSRLPSDPIERHFSKYKQVTGGEFLVSLREVNNSEIKTNLSSILEESINFWEEHVYCNDDTDNKFLKVENKLSNLTKEILEATLKEDSKQAAVAVAGYIMKTLSGRTNRTDCTLKLIEMKYLLRMMSISLYYLVVDLLHFALLYLIFQFSMLDFISSIVLKKIKNVSIGNVS